jgi:hypothetical protein
MKDINNLTNSEVQLASENNLRSKKLNYWILKNSEVMNQISINEPVCWREVDTPGIRIK